MEKIDKLEKTYERIINVGFCLVPYEDMSDIIAKSPVVYGTAKDERFFSFDGIDSLFKAQYNQMGQMTPRLEQKRIANRFSKDANHALIVEELKFSISSPDSEVVNTIFIRATCMMEYIDDKWKLVHWHTSTPVETEDDPWHLEEWKRENEKLQKLVDQQTADLQSKNRELEIEAALERVRTKTMAMQQSKELNIVVAALYQELNQLEIGDWGCNIMIFDASKAQIEIWLAETENRVFPDSFKFRTNEHEFIHKQWEIWKNQSDEDISLIGQNKISYDNFILEKTDFKLLPLEIKEQIKKLEEIHFSFVTMKFGLLAVIDTKRVIDANEKSILKRFARVFEQTYTRFLDLQNSEAQAKEAKIEVALEKVRSRSLGMRKSDEINEVVAVLFQKMKDLKIPFTAVGIAIRIEGSKDMNAFVCGENPEGLVLTNYRLPYFDNPVPKQLYNALEKQLEYYVGHYTKAEKDAFYTTVLEQTPEFKHLPEDIKRMIFDSTDYTISMVAVKNAVFNVNDFEGKVLAEAEIEIIKRFAKVFDQAYTRFLDLQRVETQAKEAQIEVALERVRARASAMHKSEELKEVALELRHQMTLLGQKDLEVCGIHLYEMDDAYFESWGAMRPEGSNEIIQGQSRFPKKGVTIIEEMLDHYYAGKKDYVLVNEGKKATEFFGMMKIHAPKVFEYFVTLLDRIPAQERIAYWSLADFHGGSILMVTYHPPDEDSRILLRKVANVFDLAYRRFLDLKNAEAQAREVQIETALEKVRSRTMAMQKSTELSDTAALMFKQIEQLGLQPWSCSFNIWDHQNKKINQWVSSGDGRILPPFETPENEDVFARFLEASKNGEPIYVEEIGGESLKKHYDYMKSLPVLGNIIAEMNDSGIQFPTYQVFNAAFFSHGYLLFITYEPTLEFKDIYKRFAHVFEQTYTRFLDLQKAEERAREAQIDAAIERLRNRTMAMQKSSELANTAQILFQELENLGIETWAAGFDIFEDNSHISKGWISMKGQLTPAINMPHNEDPTFIRIFEKWKNNENFYSEAVGGQELMDHYEYMGRIFQESIIGMDDPNLEPFIPPTYQVFNAAYFSYGYLMFITYEDHKENYSIYQRFAKVFEQTYIRFLDLQKAEEQAKEARIELSLERIRSQVTAMQDSSDLLEIMVNMRKEFVALGHEAHYFWHMRWLPDQYEKAMTSGDGTQIGMVMKLPRKIHSEIKDVANWEKSNNPTFVLAMETEKAVDYVDKMIRWGDFERVDPQAPTLEDIRHIKGLTFVMARTTHGEIGFSLPGCVQNPSEDAVTTLVRFAAVFDLAYKRFQDLKKAEKDILEIKFAKQKAEETLEELRATQAQLIQQEKLASLGQLTAGIAHEIKNPLNFVTNFSELSTELIDEVDEELQKETKDIDFIFVMETLNDIKSNLEKIQQHGKRADGIVKSMLQHSRGGSGKLEPALINPIITEFVNLAFHGMRAGKNPINVKINLDLDDEINDVPLIVEDFSRVILNLCNNAFDAMRELISSNKDYKAELSIQSKKSVDGIYIEITDNGPGIPDALKNQIMQPFFTTKKGTEGTGLGLSITNDIIKAHRGNLQLESKIGKGTKFTIFLPYQPNISSNYSKKL